MRSGAVILMEFKMATRTQYETEEDLKNEERIVAKLVDLLKKHNEGEFKTVKLTKEQRLDFAIMRKIYENGHTHEECCMVVEVKKRDGSSHRYEDLMISKSKFLAGKGEAKNGRKFLILIEYADGIFWFEYDDQKDIAIKVSGRSTQTRDKWDVEPCAHIPMHHFKRLPGTF